MLKKNLNRNIKYISPISRRKFIFKFLKGSFKLAAGIIAAYQAFKNNMYDYLKNFVIGKNHLYPIHKETTTISKEGELLVRSATGETYILNQTGRVIWALCNGKNSVDQIVKKLATHYRQKKSICQCDVVDFLTNLRQMKMIIYV